MTTKKKRQKPGPKPGNGPTAQRQIRVGEQDWAEWLVKAERLGLGNRAALIRAAVKEYGR